MIKALEFTCWIAMLSYLKLGFQTFCHIPTSCYLSLELTLADLLGTMWCVMNRLNPESYGAITLADVNLQTGSLTPLHIDPFRRCSWTLFWQLAWTRWITNFGWCSKLVRDGLLAEWKGTKGLCVICILPWAVGLSLGMLNYGKAFRCELSLVPGVICCDDSC